MERNSASWCFSPLFLLPLLFLLLFLLLILLHLLLGRYGDRVRSGCTDFERDRPSVRPWSNLGICPSPNTDFRVDWWRERRSERSEEEWGKEKWGETKNDFRRETSGRSRCPAWNHVVLAVLSYLLIICKSFLHKAEIMTMIIQLIAKTRLMFRF